MEPTSRKPLVNPVALQKCFAKFGEHQVAVMDVSFVRLVLAEPEEEIFPPLPQTFDLELHFDRFVFSATVSLQNRGDGWIRLHFEKIVPSARAHLRSFLSPKKVGESLIEDWRTDFVRHYHGLNEAELSFEPNGGILFSYSDFVDVDSQFVIRIAEIGGPLRAGKLLRKDYIRMSSIESELPLIGLTDRDIFIKLGECRDIVTNFRPSGQIEYNVKQRLLKVISDYLYSTSPKVEFSQPRPTRTVTHMLNET